MTARKVKSETAPAYGDTKEKIQEIRRALDRRLARQNRADDDREMLAAGIRFTPERGELPPWTLADATVMTFDDDTGHWVP